MYKIIFYNDKNGCSSVLNYIETLKEKRFTSKDAKIKFKKISSYIDMLSESGLEIGEPYIKHLEDEIWELRPLRDRILFAYYDNNKFILLHCFMKKTQKTPRKEIKEAKNNLEDYKRRSDRNEWKRINMGRSKKKS